MKLVDKIMKVFVVLAVLFFIAEAKPKQRVCEVGKPSGYGACQSTDPPCQKGYECVGDVCCKRGRVCPVGKPLGYGPCDENGECLESDQYCYSNEAGDKLCCKVGSEEEEDDDDDVQDCPIDPCLTFTNCDPSSSLDFSTLTCTFDPATCSMTIRDSAGADVTAICLPNYALK
ncbi:uncharacterized protein LOC111110802 [Crassostrea virginica]|uniref:Uncharacterized protein LOC111110802 isoform X2 n=1 Tax=Crassostrea virginica TaxID=6565 RepID=A0A8B8BJV3_CRAVI|nr:uncharacterized protein LOC111110802 isoform X2 [Crassostrea virginica]